MILPNFKEFQSFIWKYYHEHKREMPWRNIADPYGIVVSEIMLQQTQVPRVMVKYPEFMAKFPTFKALAEASLPEVLTAWQGMGYNRRGKYLQQIAQKVMNEHQGILPDDPKVLQTFPGLGYATAHSIVAFAFNKPVIFIETNIRRVFIHHFFADEEGVHDKELFPLVKASLDHSNPREWYYALMDYGTYLAKQVPNPNRKSKHYTKQSKFEGSVRQVRGEVLRKGLSSAFSYEDILSIFPDRGDQIEKVLSDMTQEGFLVKDEGMNTYQINK